ncbi:choline dehydrogenase [Prosthecodimorpha staleyi]|uniref:Choline dehydrogenase n=1 Tax=Prosthecodimorpha staleyi TaxID=2840188 RepID=A0A947GJQ5_9HYPH|nr:choline dehydrogenase [Prosthecodimorpha staleyi]MBT9292144.1 choline dehydrogenase [Prosthecodimorpha staleyi]
MEFDFVIVGSGSAGSVLAARLTEDGRHSAIVLERGGWDGSIFIQMPTALSIPMNQPRYNWFYETEAEPHLGGRHLHVPRGKVIGGSSSINGMVYIRGNPADFDRWAEEGADGWSYADVLPYFKRAETRAAGETEYRGGSGPLNTSYGTLKNPLYRAFVEAGREAGYAETDDVNGYRQEGFGRMDMTVHRGRRWSTANAYLKPALKRKNLAVMTDVLVTRVVFEAGRAVGVEIERGGARETIRARREVILSAGSIGSPQLLKLSGIGPGAELGRLGIPLLADRPGVGENLQDHLEFYFQVAAREPVTLYSHMNPLAKALIGMRWILRRDGLGATNHFETCGFIRSRAGIRYPDIQYHFLPAAVRYDGAAHVDRHGFQAHVGPMRSKSRGHVRLKSANPQDKPSILFNYMSHPDDWEEMRACVRLTRELFAQPAFARWRAEEIQPGADVTSDASIDDWIMRNVESAYHPSCTARMGRRDDPQAVVDGQGRVYGVDGLRVADSSIMPSITTGNLNAPTIMIGEKIADHVLGRTPLPRSNAPYFIHPEWASRQR